MNKDLVLSEVECLDFANSCEYTDIETNRETDKQLIDSNRQDAGQVKSCSFSLSNASLNLVKSIGYIHSCNIH